MRYDFVHQPRLAMIKRPPGFAKRCGVRVSASVLGNAGSHWLVESLERKLRPDHGRGRLHFYPFGALIASAEWINDYAARHQGARG